MAGTQSHRSSRQTEYSSSVLGNDQAQRLFFAWSLLSSTFQVGVHIDGVGLDLVNACQRPPAVEHGGSNGGPSRAHSPRRWSIE